MSHSQSGRNIALWIAQGLLAAVFLFAGPMKLMLPAAKLTQVGPYSAGFLRFIGLCETLGAIGVVLPWLTGIRRTLTPLAAACLVVIMCGATFTSYKYMAHDTAVLPAIVGLVALWVALGRWRDLRAV